LNIIQKFFITILTSFLIVENNGVDKPNFILYLSDDQDYLDYGIYGNERVDSEHVDKLASQGLKFTNFHTAQAICAPNLIKILSKSIYRNNKLKTERDKSISIFCSCFLFLYSLYFQDKD